ncbi:MAG: hypothetical protein ABMB14_21240 [Myxococcota bacterium]
MAFSLVLGMGLACAGAPTEELAPPAPVAGDVQAPAGGRGTSVAPAPKRARKGGGGGGSIVAGAACNAEAPPTCVADFLATCVNGVWEIEDCSTTCLRVADHPEMSLDFDTCDGIL